MVVATIDVHTEYVGGSVRCGYETGMLARGWSVERIERRSSRWLMLLRFIEL